MTLILCLRGDGCVVMAADSLTTTPSKVLSTKTVKVHQTSERSLAVACGAAQLNGQYWSAILKRFAPDTVHTTAADLRVFLDSEIANASKTHGACAGGNTFVVADLPPPATDPDIWFIDRIADRRHFLDERLESAAEGPRYIEWFGDTSDLGPALDRIGAAYLPRMPEDKAREFARNALIEAIDEAQHAGIRTIGGDFITIGSISQAGVSIETQPF